MRKKTRDLIVFLFFFTLEGAGIAYLVVYLAYNVKSFANLQPLLYFMLPTLLVLMCVIAYINIYEYFFPESEYNND